MSLNTRYPGENKTVGFYIVKFVVKETGKVIERGFLSLYDAKIFVNRLKHSKRCEVLSHPSFD